MDLELTDVQQELASTVGRLLKERYDLGTRDKLLSSDEGYSDDMWNRYAELGLLGLPFGEEYGGAGMGFPEVAVVMEQFGKALVLEPYLATVVIAGGLVNEAGSDEQKQELLGSVAEGSLKLAFAGEEPDSRWSLNDPQTTATASGDGFTLSGEKTGVLGGPSADKLIVSAAVDGGVGLFVVDAAGEGVTVHSLTQADGLRSAKVLLKDAPATRLGDGDARQAIARVVEVATAALCSEAAGAMDASLNMTVDYLKTRVQFGVPIGSFQALQHRAADMYESLEAAKSMALLSNLSVSGEQSDESSRNVLAAKIQSDRSGKHIWEESIQMHGGIGMTMEYPIGHYAKRLMVISKTFADTDMLIERLGQAGGLIEPKEINV